MGDMYVIGMREDELTFKTNGHWRDVIFWWDLTDKERAWFDYVESPDEFSGFRYRGSVYDLGEFEVAPDSYKARGFDGVQTESMFSAVAVGLHDEDGEYVGAEQIKVAYVHW